MWQLIYYKKNGNVNLWIDSKSIDVKKKILYIISNVQSTTIINQNN